jgi:hypothetical protein
MKTTKLLGLLCAAFILSAVLLPAPAACSDLRVSFKLYGGLNYLSGSDLNDGLKGMNDYYDRYFWFFGLTRSGEEFRPVHLGFNFGGDFIVQITPLLGVGLGAGYFQGMNESLATYGPVAASVKTNPKLSAVPLRLGLNVTLPAGALMNINFHGGLGYYLARMSYDLRSTAPGSWFQYSVEAEASGFGFHGGIGLEFKLSPTISLFFEGQGRYARIGGFHGSIDIADSSGGHGSENGKLYCYKYIIPPLGTFPVILVSDTVPSGSSVSDVREAKIDLSGFSLVLGMIFHF